MKTLSILAIILFALTGCQPNPDFDKKDTFKIEVQRPTGYMNLEFQQFELNGCEYYVGTNHNSVFHKGNCKYCRGADKELEKTPKPVTVKP